MDHRDLGKQLDLFHMEEESPGVVFWHPHGWTIWQQIEQYMRGIYKTTGFKEVKSPQILNKSLWETTGHWDKYKANMFVTETEKREYALKPMNCPGHVLIFKQGTKSYRDLPLRFGEFGQCHRNESSGSMHGIMRVRGFTQDDGHIFCTEDQIQKECIDFISTAKQVYAKFGFENVKIKLALRPASRIGADDLWDKAEQALASCLDSLGMEYEVSPGDGAFYGPKLELTLLDSANREWQCGTIQVDFSLCERLDAKYKDHDGLEKTPIMLHRAILGSFERFIGILLENGKLPDWLAPVQIVVCGVSNKFDAYAIKVHEHLSKNYRAELDIGSEKLTHKIQEHSTKMIPYIIVVGGKDEAANTIAVRYDNATTTIPLFDFVI